MKWNAFEIDEVQYDLTHLNTSTFNFNRPATETSEEKTVKITLSFSDHCFTDHHGDSDDWIYADAQSQGTRFFCKTRYELSKHLPDLIRSLLESNPYLLLTFLRHREQFFYLEEEFHGESYRVFLEVSAPIASYTDIRIDVKSAYDEKPWAKPVQGSVRYKLWRIIDARLDGVQLQRKRKR